MNTIIDRLVAHTGAIEYDKLKPGAIAAAKRALLDALGCGIAAIGCEPAAIAGRTVPGGAQEVTVYGEAQRCSLERGVLVNGILVRYLDMMDVYSAKDVCHPAENVPLALACVESSGGSGRRLLEAIIAGYEGQMRLAHTLPLQQLGMHHVSAGGIVAPLVIGKAWGLAGPVIAQAAALSGCRQFAVHALAKGGLSMAKAIGYAWAGMDAVLATRLAQQGYTGPTGFIDWLGTDGPLQDGVEPDAIDSPMEQWMIERVSYKQFPVQFELQTPVEIAIDMRDDIGAHAADIARVEVRVRPITIKRTADGAKYQPQNRETADHSLPVCVAMALLDGKLTAAQFESGRWSAPEVLKLAQRVAVIADPEYDTLYPGGRPTALAVQFADGRTIKAFQAAPLGDASRPMNDAAIERKFLANAAETLGARRADEILQCVRGVESLAQVSDLTRLLAKP